MHRRRFLQVAGGVAAVPLVFGSTRSAIAGENFARESCYSFASKGTEMVSWPSKPGPYSIAISNSYIGNSWRTEMMKIGKAFASKPEIKRHIKDFTAASSGNDVSAQIAELNQLTLRGTDAVILDAANPTGLNSAIEQAVDAGTLVVSFDNVVTTKKAVLCNEDQYEMGLRRAKFIKQQINGKGKVLLVRGVAGTFVDQEHAKAAHKVFGDNKDIEVVEVVGNWDNGTAQKVTANALAVHPDIAGVVSGGGDTGVVRAFLQAGKEMVPMAGEAENGFRRLAAKHQFPMLSVGNSPAEVAVSIRAALDILQGKKVPRAINLPLPIADTSSLKAGENYFPDQPDSFYTDFNIPGCSTNLTLEEISRQQV